MRTKGLKTLKYQTSCINSPDSEQGIRVRHDVLLRKFFLKFNNIEPKDQNRLFDEHQKIVIYSLRERKCVGVSNFKCPNANKVLPFEECEFDHIKEHSAGGKTTVQNGQVLCKECHNYKTRMYRFGIKR